MQIQTALETSTTLSQFSLMYHVHTANGPSPVLLIFPLLCPECPVCAVLCCAMAPMSFAWCMRIFLALPSALTLAMAQRQSRISLPIRFRFCFPYQLTQFRNRVTSVLFIYHTSTCTEHCARPQYGPFMKDHKHGLFGWQKENKQNKQNKPMWVVRHTLRSVYNIFYSVFGKVL